MSRARRVNLPRPTTVDAGPGGAPRAVARMTVVSIREEWVVEDRWWTGRPVHRHYYELALADGRVLTVFREVRSSRWYRQAA